MSTHLQLASADLKMTANRVIECDEVSFAERKRVLEDCVDFLQQRAAQCWAPDPDEDLL
jgi:hypothetical protein